MTTFDRALASPSLTDAADIARLRWSASADDARRAELGQFFTPATVGRFMASLFQPRRTVRLLDPGAGIGSLTAAFVEVALAWQRPPAEIEVVACEADDRLAIDLRETMKSCREACDAVGTRFKAHVVSDDFLDVGVAALEHRLFKAAEVAPFDAVIANPPYRKIQSASRERAVLRRAGIETSNLYAAFIAVAARLLRQGGELVAITPRSFCNGPYFRPFREGFFAEMTLDRAHVFENHLNYFHVGGRGMDRLLAAGLAAYLNSTLVDDYFRQESGHTQVNASDLRRLRYPTRDQLLRIGRRIGSATLEQRALDRLVSECIAP